MVARNQEDVPEQTQEDVPEKTQEDLPKQSQTTPPSRTSVRRNGLRNVFAPRGNVYMMNSMIVANRKQPDCSRKLDFTRTVDDSVPSQIPVLPSLSATQPPSQPAAAAQPSIVPSQPAAAQPSTVPSQPAAAQPSTVTSQPAAQPSTVSSQPAAQPSLPEPMEDSKSRRALSIFDFEYFEEFYGEDGVYGDVFSPGEVTRDLFDEAVSLIQQDNVSGFSWVEYGSTEREITRDYMLFILGKQPHGFLLDPSQKWTGLKELEKRVDDAKTVNPWLFPVPPSVSDLHKRTKASASSRKQKSRPGNPKTIDKSKASENPKTIGDKTKRRKRK